MKKISKILFIALFTIFASCGIVSTVSYADEGGYTIKAYDVDIEVTKQNVYKVRETILVNFSQYRHGIYRDIPIVNRITRQDGSKDTIYALIKNVNCSDEADKSRLVENYQLKIGDENKKIIGDKTYTISYDYCMGNDRLEGADEFYFNIIGNGWDTTIDDVTFSIKMPADFDKNRLGFSHGKKGSTDTDGIRYTVVNNTIKGMYVGQLMNNESLTVRQEFDDGYFDVIEEKNTVGYVGFSFGIITVIIAFALWYVIGRDGKVIPVVSFYPPDNITPTQMALLCNETVNNKDVVTLLIYLADKGYLSIEEVKGSGGFMIHKLKSYDGNNKAEQLFMEGLFASGKIATKATLNNVFYKTVNAIISEENSKQKKAKYFMMNSLNKNWILFILSYLAMVISVFKPISEYEVSIPTAIVCPFVITVLGWLLVYCVGSKVNSIISKIIAIIILALAYLLTYFMFMNGALTMFGGIFNVAYITSLIGVLICAFFGKIMSKRTPVGLKLYGETLGFKEFLVTAQKDQLEQMVEENPTYFYNVLPYAYVLGVSNKWIKKFESITVEQPSWYSSSSLDTFSIMHFHSFMNSTYSSCSSAMTSSPSSSGGGSSGGGSGGGGGGSW